MVISLFTNSSHQDDDTVYESPKPITHDTIKLSHKLEPILQATLHRCKQLPLTTSHATPSTTSCTTPRTTTVDARKSVAKKTS